MLLAALLLSAFLPACTARFSFMEPVVIERPVYPPPPVIRR